MQEEKVGKLQVGQELYYVHKTHHNKSYQFGYCRITYIGRKYLTVDRIGWKHEKVEIATMRSALTDSSVFYYTSREAYEQYIERKHKIAFIENYTFSKLPTEAVNEIYELITTK